MKLKEHSGQPLERTTILLSLLNFFLVSEAGANKKGIEEELKGKKVQVLRSTREFYNLHKN